MYSRHTYFKFLACALWLALSLPGYTAAQDFYVDLPTKSKLILRITKSSLAGELWPSSTRLEERPTVLVLPSQHSDKTLPNGCGASGSNAICYDYRSGLAVFKPVRNLLPTIPGLMAQNLAIHRHTLVASYNFK